MTTTTSHHAFHAPNGKVLRRLSRPIEPVDVAALQKEYDAWYAENERLLKGYGVGEFLEEKRRGVER